jgi:uncharacterized protein YkwD
MDELLESHNRERLSRGLPSVVASERLMAAAQKHADWMRSRRRMSHRGAGFSSPAQRVTAEGYRFTSVSENIAAGQTSAAQVMRSWMNSRGHRNNILGRNREIGLGRAGNYWCVVFGTPRS